MLRFPLLPGLRRRSGRCVPGHPVAAAGLGFVQRTVGGGHQLLRRAFGGRYERRNSDAGIDIDSCARRGGKLKIIASIEEPEVIAKTLAHLERTGPPQHQSEMPLGARGPPEPLSLL